MKLEQVKPPVSVSDVFRRLIDSVTLGKVLADGVPGLTLALGVLLALAATEDLRVLPVESFAERRQYVVDHEVLLFGEQCRKVSQAPDRSAAGADAQPQCRRESAASNSLEGRAKAVARRVLAKLESSNGTRADDPASDAGVAMPSLERGDDPKLFLHAEIERLQAKKQELKTKKDATAERTAARHRIDKDIESLDARLVPLELVVAQLTAARERLTELRAEADEAASISTNLGVITANTESLLFLALIFAVLMGQVNRVIFVRGIYDWLYYRNPDRADERAYRNDPDVIPVEKMEELVSHYYRYVEAATNMVFPALVLGVATERFLSDLVEGSLWDVVILGATTLAVGALFWSGYATYYSFRAKVRQLKLAADAAAAKEEEAKKRADERRKEMQAEASRRERALREEESAALARALASAAMATAREVRCAKLEPCPPDHDAADEAATEGGPE